MGQGRQAGRWLATCGKWHVPGCWAQRPSARAKCSSPFVIKWGKTRRRRATMTMQHTHTHPHTHSVAEGVQGGPENGIWNCKLCFWPWPKRADDSRQSTPAPVGVVAVAGLMDDNVRHRMVAPYRRPPFSTPLFDSPPVRSAGCTGCRVLIMQTTCCYSINLDYVCVIQI